MKYETNLRIFLSLLFLFQFTGCYLSTQGYAFLSMQFSAEDTEKMLRDPATDEQTRRFLTRVNDIKAFGENQLGLSRGKNFSTFTQLDRNWVALIVHASPALSLESHHWNYPVVGKLPYKGFFKEKDAVKEAEKLKKKGFDVIIRPVEAFSTLGFFKDPLYSFMLNYDEYELANLIFHEETHATVFLKKHADFNEEFASFVGDTAAFIYLESVYGKDRGDDSRKKNLDASEDSAAFRLDMTELAARLRAVYDSASLSQSEKLLQKEKTIADFQAEFVETYQTKYKTANYKAFSERTVNNAYICLFLLYGEHQNRFARVYDSYNGDLRAFIQDVVSAAKKAKDPWEALSQMAQ